MNRSDNNTWEAIQPGDIGLDGGVGLIGWVIRTGTQSQHGHAWVYHCLLNILDDGTEVWETVEAAGDGVQFRRRTRRPNKVVRVWHNDDERREILKRSASLVGARYGWGEIVRIVLRILGVRLRRRKDNPRRVICSNHSFQSALAARPDLEFYTDYEPFEVWPGELAMLADRWDWAMRQVGAR